jgi:uncharacterized protein
MELLNHDLAHEFPEHLEKMRELKMSDQHFAKLFADYDETNKSIIHHEQSGMSIADEALEELKKKRLKIKDDIYQILKSH